MKRYRNIVFDLGDVLLGYRWKQMLMDYGLAEQDADRVGTELFDNPEQLWHHYDLGDYTEDELCQAYTVRFPKDAAAMEYFIRHGEYMTVPRPKVWAKVHALKQTGCRIYLLSNYPEVLFHKHTEYCDFMKDLDGMVISYACHESKPDRAIYERLCRTYGLVPSECLFFDDREENVQGALDYGMAARKVESQESLLQDLDGLLEEMHCHAARSQRS